MLPILEAATETTTNQLQLLISKMKEPIPENFSVENTFASDGYRYFHCGLSEKWSRKLARLEPEEGEVTVIDLPDSIDMRNSKIFQIEEDVF